MARCAGLGCSKVPQYFGNLCQTERGWPFCSHSSTSGTCVKQRGGGHFVPTAVLCELVSNREGVAILFPQQYFGNLCQTERGWPFCSHSSTSGTCVKQRGGGHFVPTAVLRELVSNREGVAILFPLNVQMFQVMGHVVQ